MNDILSNTKKSKKFSLSKTEQRRQMLLGTYISIKDNGKVEDYCRTRQISKSEFVKEALEKSYPEIFKKK